MNLPTRLRVTWTSRTFFALPVPIPGLPAHPTLSASSTEIIKRSKIAFVDTTAQAGFTTIPSPIREFFECHPQLPPYSSSFVETTIIYATDSSKSTRKESGSSLLPRINGEPSRRSRRARNRRVMILDHRRGLYLRLLRRMMRC